jgi:hypothetical protein
MEAFLVTVAGFKPSVLLSVTDCSANCAATAGFISGKIMEQYALKMLTMEQHALKM